MARSRSPGFLSRYQMKRGLPASELPKGVRQDTRKHTRHVLRPPADAAERFLAAPDDRSFRRFAAEYRAAVEARWAEDPRPFDELAELAREQPVYLGCSCPTRHNPDLRRCHTWLALEMMAERYPDLDVRFPVLDGA